MPTIASFLGSYFLTIAYRACANLNAALPYTHIFKSAWMIESASLPDDLLATDRAIASRLSHKNRSTDHDIWR